MNSSESEKAAIIAEIEENVAATGNSTQKLKALGQVPINFKIFENLLISILYE